MSELTRHRSIGIPAYDNISVEPTFSTGSPPLAFYIINCRVGHHTIAGERRPSPPLHWKLLHDIVHLEVGLLCGGAVDNTEACVAVLTP